MQADEKQQLLAEAIEALPLYTPPQSDCKSASEIATRYLPNHRKQTRLFASKNNETAEEQNSDPNWFFPDPDQDLTFQIIFQILHEFC